MLRLPDQALLIKLFYMNSLSATVALRKFRASKKLKARKGSTPYPGILKLVQRFQETSRLETSRPFSTKGSDVMEDMVAESSEGNK
ncbi:hypothetical protein AVEN_154894-1 [Araneus ventricosus]|uniref:DUF4817 domain-containing protein n=1 Tax=Araneus ventricosus TaxID=182803 RepID=A0A4Y2A9G0_ARAVE|nr:hypothetical protein AVEN_154894-1 [Araneus ventricosus]